METANPVIWLQTAITVAAIGMTGWLVKRWMTGKVDSQTEKIKSAELRQKFALEKIENQLKLDEKKYVRSDMHHLLCRNNELEIKTFFNEEMTKLKDEVFSELRTIKNLIINNGQKPKAGQ